jgi:hypothetical protein
MCAVSPVVHTSNISSCQKELFQFSCGCEQLLLLQMFVITEDIMKHPVYQYQYYAPIYAWVLKVKLQYLKTQYT